MDDPFVVLGLPPDSDETAIRKRYLELVRQFPPERAPEKFATVRRAYDQLRDASARVRARLFEPHAKLEIDTLVKELECQTSRRRLTLQTLLQMVRRT